MPKEMFPQPPNINLSNFKRCQTKLETQHGNSKPNIPLLLPKNAFMMQQEMKRTTLT